MASYHISVKSISRSAGRSAVAAAAYRSGERLFDARYGVEHDYTRKGGVEHTELVAPEDAPDWAQDRDRLWNEVEANENRKNSMVAREWEVALPAELSDADRRALAVGFARTLVDRYGVVADVAVHAPHREGDDRNHHAHILTTTREIGADGFGAKTRILDVKQTASVEVSEMREHWAERQNEALERMGAEDRVDHRTLEAQREEVEAERDRLARELEAERRASEKPREDRVSEATRAYAQRIFDQAGLGDRSSKGQKDRDWSELEQQLARKTLEAAALDREPEVKLGPAVNAMERKAVRDADRAGRSYQPVTDAGQQVQELRERRSSFREAIEQLGQVRDQLTGAVRDAVAWLRTGQWPSEEASREVAAPTSPPKRGDDRSPTQRASDAAVEWFARQVDARIEAERRANLEKRLAALGRGHKAPEGPGPDHQRDEAERRAGLQDRSVTPQSRPRSEIFDQLDAQVRSHLSFRERGDERASEQAREAAEGSLLLIYRRVRETIQGITEESHKTATEKALSAFMRDYNTVFSEESRLLLGRCLKREKIGDVDLSDLDGVRQRVASAREAQPDRLDQASMRDKETQQAQERLARADRGVIEHARLQGLDGDRILQRISDAPNVDRLTRDEWAERDIEAISQSHAIGEPQARELYERIMRDASRFYAKARDEIRVIKQGPEREALSDPRGQKRSRSRDDDRGIDR